MISHLIPLLSTDMYRNLPDQTVEVLNRLIMEVNEAQTERRELVEAIIMLRKQISGLQPRPTPPVPTPTGEWQQILPFYPEQMGHTEHRCLENVREGYLIAQGISTSAYTDMLYNRSQGTLHEETPPADIAVPVYCGSGTINGHVVVWDHGVVWSDGEIVPEGLAHWNVLYGWGELCDHVRVVAPTT